MRESCYRERMGMETDPGAGAASDVTMGLRVRFSWESLAGTESQEYHLDELSPRGMTALLEFILKSLNPLQPNPWINLNTLLLDRPCLQEQIRFQRSEEGKLSLETLEELLQILANEIRPPSILTNGVEPLRDPRRLIQG